MTNANSKRRGAEECISTCNLSAALHLKQRSEMDGDARCFQLTQYTMITNSTCHIQKPAVGRIPRGIKAGILTVLAAALITSLSGCGGGSSAGSDSSGTVPVISTQPASVTAKEGQSITFSVIAQSSAPLNYQWLRNGQAIPGATQSTYTLTVVVGDTNSTFSVRVSSPAGAVESQVATLVVNPLSGIVQMFNGQTINGDLIGVDATGASYIRNGTSITKLGLDGKPMPYGVGTEGVTITASNSICGQAPAPSAIVTADGTVYASTFSVGGGGINVCTIQSDGQIQKIDPSGQKISSIKPTNGESIAPIAFTKTPDGSVYFVDAIGPKIRKISINDEVTTFASLFSQGQITDRYSYILGRPLLPSISNNNSGDLYISSGPSETAFTQIKKISSAASQTEFAGNGDGNIVDGNLGNASFKSIRSLQWLASSSTLLALDGDSAVVVRELDAQTGTVRTIAGQPTSTATDLMQGSLPGVLGPYSNYQGTKNLLTGADGGIYITTKNKVFKIIK